MFSVLVSLPVVIYLINFVLYAATVVAHEGPSFHTTTIYGRPTTWTTTFTPSVSYTPSVSPTPPSYPPTSDTSTYPPTYTTDTSPTYPPSSVTYTTDTTATYPPSSSVYLSDSTLTYPPSSSSYDSSIPYPTNTSAYPTYTPSYPAPPSQGFSNDTVYSTDGRIITHGDGWQTTNESCGGTGKSCSQIGLYLNFTFTGTAVYMWTSLNQHSGTCSVAIDNVTPVSIDGYSPNPICVIAWSAYGLTNGSHTVIVTNLGQSQKATSAGEYNATIYSANGFIITTTTTHSASAALMATNSLYLIGTLMVALLVSY